MQSRVREHHAKLDANCTSTRWHVTHVMATPRMSCCTGNADGKGKGSRCGTEQDVQQTSASLVMNKGQIRPTLFPSPPSEVHDDLDEHLY